MGYHLLLACTHTSIVLLSVCAEWLDGCGCCHWVVTSDRASHHDQLSLGNMLQLSRCADCCWSSGTGWSVIAAMDGSSCYGSQLNHRGMLFSSAQEVSYPTLFCRLFSDCGLLRNCVQWQVILLWPSSLVLGGSPCWMYWYIHYHQAQVVHHSVAYHTVSGFFWSALLLLLCLSIYTQASGNEQKIRPSQAVCIGTLPAISWELCHYSFLLFCMWEFLTPLYMVMYRHQRQNSDVMSSLNRGLWHMRKHNRILCLFVCFALPEWKSITTL